MLANLVKSRPACRSGSHLFIAAGSLLLVTATSPAYSDDKRDAIQQVREIVKECKELQAQVANPNPRLTKNIEAIELTLLAAEGQTDEAIKRAIDSNSQSPALLQLALWHWRKMQVVHPAVSKLDAAALTAFYRIAARIAFEKGQFPAGREQLAEYLKLVRNSPAPLVNAATGTHVSDCIKFAETAIHAKQMEEARQILLLVEDHVDIDQLLKGKPNGPITINSFGAGPVIELCRVWQVLGDVKRSDQYLSKVEQALARQLNGPSPGVKSPAVARRLAFGDIVRCRIALAKGYAARGKTELAKEQLDAAYKEIQSASGTPFLAPMRSASIRELTKALHELGDKDGANRILAWELQQVLAERTGPSAQGGLARSQDLAQSLVVAGNREGLQALINGAQDPLTKVTLYLIAFDADLATDRSKAQQQLVEAEAAFASIAEESDRLEPAWGIAAAYDKVGDAAKHAQYQQEFDKLAAGSSLSLRMLLSRLHLSGEHAAALAIVRKIADPAARVEQMCMCAQYILAQ